jgi:hypothetical protein
MADNGVPVQWERLRHDALCERSGVILGAARATTDEPTLTFIATNKPNGDVIITVNADVALADVHAAAVWRTSPRCPTQEPTDDHRELLQSEAPAT